MKTKSKMMLTVAVGLLLSFLLGSCSADSPFSDEDGMATVRMNIDIKSKLTRADEESYDLQSLYNSCKIYIVNPDNKVLHKWVGIASVTPVSLKYGSYRAEAYAGDSVTASFEKKYFKGQTPFTVSENNGTVYVNCKIANVVASVDADTLAKLPLEDVKVSFSNSKGTLDFSGEGLMKKGYFMMPQGDGVLNYTVTAKQKIDGKQILKEGKIEGVLPAHEYRLKFTSGGGTQSGGNGAAIVSIRIEEEPVYDEEIVIKAAPTFSWSGQNTPGIDEQLVADFTRGTPVFQDYLLRIGAFDGFRSIDLTSSDPEIQKTISTGGFNIIGATDAEREQLANNGRGIICDLPKVLNESADTYVAYIKFSKEWLESLSASSNEHVLTVEAVDMQTYRRTSKIQVRIASSVNAVEVRCLVVPDAVAFSSNPMNVMATKAVIPVNIYSNYSGYAGLRYRATGGEWQTVNVLSGSGSGSNDGSGRITSKKEVTLSGLTPGATYEYQIVAGAQKDDGEYESSTKSATFTTETIFSIPNSSMENWSNFVDNTSVIMPSADGKKTFWDTGNHGSATMDKNITQKATSIFHSGSASAELKSQFVGLGIVGKFAAGNIFTGEYVGTEGTNGILSFGAPYNESHPSALSLWVKYTPGTVEDGGEKSGYLKAGDKDQGIIYIALVTDAVEIRTKTAKLLKDKNGLSKEVLAYGEYIFEDVYSDGNGMKKVTIPFKYGERALKEKPTRLIIVCSASRYGDYFCGGEGSLMYVDDFELEYGEVTFGELKYQ